MDHFFANIPKNPAHFDQLVVCGLELSHLDGIEIFSQLYVRNGQLISIVMFVFRIPMVLWRSRDAVCKLPNIC